MEKQDNKIRFTNAFKDILVIVIITAGILALSFFLNLFTFLVELFQKSPRLITYIDEIIAALLTLSIGLAVFSWRRLRELKEETAKRIKLQEELIKCANTKAETEHIIVKQLHVELEERKREEGKYTARPPKGKGRLKK
ncbi:MAG: hypothetical protein PHF11_03500 [Candidatus Omnitrophica bacterium]|nr:hypothetical protein [Candidatus Omnitrophota bacterium]